MNVKDELRNMRQLCVVVRDLDAAIARYKSIFDLDFDVITYDAAEIPGVFYRGKDGKYAIKVAKALVGGWELELICPQRGESVYSEFLSEHGEGLHHIGVFVNDFEKAQRELIGQGLKSIMGGPIPGEHRNGRFEYFEQDPGLGLIIELLDDPDAPDGFVRS